MLNLRNEFILAPVKLGYSDKTGVVNQKHIDFYNQRSKHIGAVTPEPFFMDAGLRELPTQMGIDSNEKIEGLKKLTDTIHKNGAKAIAHLNHPGRMANPKIPGNYFLSSTDKACENGGAIPEKMNRKKMDDVINLFVESAKRSVNSGFDIIELQFGHGYLMAQFISPAVNDRTDEYGGSFENRIKFPVELAKAVRKAIDIPIIARVSGDEMIPNGFHIDEMIKFSKELENIGINAIHVTAGSACTTPPWFFQHMFIPKGKTWELASKIKENVKIPVIFVGRINSEKDIKEIKTKYSADYLALGRALVADPDFIGKHTKQIKGNIRPCLACAEGCLGGVKQGKGLGCVVNPLVNTGLAEIKKSSEKKYYAVIGGGLAGMQASLTLKEKGYDVDLYEKNELGGQFNLAWLPPKKESLKEIIDYFINELKSLNVNIIKKEATESVLNDKKYDGIIMATGAIPAIPPIEGLTEYYWTEFLDDEQLPKNQKVLVIGGGLIGLEVASKLVDGNNEVIVVEMLDEIARGMEMIEKAMTMKKLKDNQTEILLNHKVIKIDKDKVFIESGDNQKIIDNINKIVIAAGMKSFVPFKISETSKIYFVGDAKKVGKAQEAIHDAYELAINL
ncbi:MAG: FAD-dependent oxidoreductase [Bacteroidales bacterium]|nr:FAD-dependent oxidoreductase [Bacteroidales bacterium]MBN2758419.1 FAD-dependent oxidoreductase [Bacteroidales bacterium]